MISILCPQFLSNKVIESSFALYLVGVLSPQEKIFKFFVAKSFDFTAVLLR